MLLGCEAPVLFVSIHLSLFVENPETTVHDLQCPWACFYFLQPPMHLYSVQMVLKDMLLLLQCVLVCAMDASCGKLSVCVRACVWLACARACVCLCV